MPKTERKKVPVHDDDKQALARLRRPGSPEAQALTDLTGVLIDTDLPESQLLHALLIAGLQATERRAEEEGYRRLAEFRKTDPDHQKWRASRRARTARRQTGELPPA